MVDIPSILKHTEEAMKRAIHHLENELVKIRAGKASPIMLDGVIVDYYGTPTPINQVGGINTPDPRTIVVEPWDKSVLPNVERAIINANLGLNPSNDGTMIRINVPTPTEERRKELVKQASAEGENSRIGLRGARHDGMKLIKALVDDGLSEDEGKRAEEKVEAMSKQYHNKVEEILKKKEAEIMTV